MESAAKQPSGAPGPGLFDHPASAARALFRVTDADRGTVERPLLAPHLEVRPLGEEAALLVSETFNAALYGRRYVDLLPLLDGTRTRHEITAALSGTYGPLELQTTLVSLASKGYVVSGEFGMGRDAAAFWCSAGVSPRWAEERLRSARASVSGDADGRLSAGLSAMGLSVATDGDGDGATLHVARAVDYLDEAHAGTNRRHLASGTPWVLVKADGVWPLFGPVFRPGEGGACWACLAHRMRGNDEVGNFLRNTAGDTAAVLPRASAPPFADAVLGLASVEIARWVVLGDTAALHGHALSLSLYDLAGERHPVTRRPQCAACGDEALHRPDRAPSPVVLGPSPKPVWNSGGLRSVPPGETVRAYRHLVSPVSGVVTQLMRVTAASDSWLHVYWAGSNLALKADSLRLLRNSLRTKSSGKGSTADQAEASALCEAVERYSGVYHGDEIRRRARFEDFAAGEAIHPNDVMLYSESQYERAKEINARGSRFNYVTARFDPGVEMDWTPVWSLTAGRHRWLPTSLLYFSAPSEGGVIYCGPDSNGCAAGNTLEEAILQGFYELAERDAFACWWYNRLSLPEVDLEGFGDDYLSGARAYYASFNRELWVLDATNDLGIPVFVAVSRRVDKEAEDILFAPGAHGDPHIAALRAVCELNQYLSAVRDVGTDGGGYLHDDPESLWWWKTAKLSEHRYLSPSPAAKRGAGDYAAAETSDLREDVERCRALVEGLGLEFLVLDQTRPDVGMPVTKTIVPGLRHFWMRFGPGRLYEVPVKMGWRETPTPEADLNPVPVFI